MGTPILLICTCVYLLTLMCLHDKPDIKPGRFECTSYVGSSPGLTPQAPACMSIFLCLSVCWVCAEHDICCTVTCSRCCCQVLSRKTVVSLVDYTGLTSTCADRCGCGSCGAHCHPNFRCDAIYIHKTRLCHAGTASASVSLESVAAQILPLEPVASTEQSTSAWVMVCCRKSI